MCFVFLWCREQSARAEEVTQEGNKQSNQNDLNISSWYKLSCCCTLWSNMFFIISHFNIVCCMFCIGGQPCASRSCQKLVWHTCGSLGYRVAPDFITSELDVSEVVPNKDNYIHTFKFELEKWAKTRLVYVFVARQHLWVFRDIWFELSKSVVWRRIITPHPID